MSIKKALSLAATFVGVPIAVAHPANAETGTKLVKRQWEPCVGSWGQSCWGDITWYDPSVAAGSCGWTSSPDEWIVAIAADVMEAQGVDNPNDNPLCGKTITITYGGQYQGATVVDTCEGCIGDSIDVSPALFQMFASLDTGRVSGVQWWFND